LIDRFFTVIALSHGDDVPRIAALLNVPPLNPGINTAIASVTELLPLSKSTAFMNTVASHGDGGQDDA
jgi:hypothetical protein